MTSTNLFADIPEELPREWVTELVRGQGVRIERIVSRGHAEPPAGWFDQTEHEWVMVLSGSGMLEFEDGKRMTLERGDHVLLPAHTKHRVVWTDPDVDTIWLAVFWSGALARP